MLNARLKSDIGKVRILAMLEGLSLIFLVLIAVPVKYLLDEPVLVRLVGPIHGFLFLFFFYLALTTGIEKKWKIQMILIVLASSFIPFGNFYVDKKYLEPIDELKIPYDD